MTNISVVCTIVGIGTKQETKEIDYDLFLRLNDWAETKYKTDGEEFFIEGGADVPLSWGEIMENYENSWDGEWVDEDPDLLSLSEW